MPFFERAHDFVIKNAQMYDAAGNVTMNDSSTHTTNTNSNNHTVTNTVDSYNTTMRHDNSTHSTNVRQGFNAQKFSLNNTRGRGAKASGMRGTVGSHQYSFGEIRKMSTEDQGFLQDQLSQLDIQLQSLPGRANQNLHIRGDGGQPAYNHSRNARQPQYSQDDFVNAQPNGWQESIPYSSKPQPQQYYSSPEVPTESMVRRKKNNPFLNGMYAKQQQGPSRAPILHHTQSAPGDFDAVYVEEDEQEEDELRNHSQS